MNSEVEDFQEPYVHKDHEEPSGISAVEKEMQGLTDFFAGESMSPEAEDTVRQMIKRITELESAKDLMKADAEELLLQICQR